MCKAYKNVLFNNDKARRLLISIYYLCSYFINDNTTVLVIVNVQIMYGIPSCCFKRYSFQINVFVHKFYSQFKTGIPESCKVFLVTRLSMLINVPLGKSVFQQ